MNQAMTIDKKINLFPNQFKQKSKLQSNNQLRKRKKKGW